LNLFFPTFPTFPTFLFAICLPRLLDVLDADENELNFAIEMLTPPGSSDAEVPETALGLRHALVLRRAEFRHIVNTVHHAYKMLVAPLILDLDRSLRE
jgi:hypothetical protein